MLKKLIVLAAALTLIPAASALAEENGPGCGLGQMVFKGNKKVVHQVLAATTNGLVGNQTFGITSGTSGCTNDGMVKNDQKVKVFASINFESLSQDMARGQGEYLASLATLMGVPAERQAAFSALTQTHYTTLFTSKDTTSTEMLVALNHVMSAGAAETR